MVRKPQDDYSKPRKFRDRRDKEKISTKREAPKNPPYEREHTNWTHSVVIDGLGEDDFDNTDVESGEESGEQSEAT